MATVAETSTISETAKAFLDACDTGKGWAGCSQFCHPGATFSVQADPLAELRTLESYSDWMKDLFALLPDGRYELRALATDQERNSVSAYAVFSGTHTGEGGPVAPTGKSTSSDYVYVMQFEDGKISHMTKIWNDGWALRELGWSG
jgi:predicted ester cyclase